MSASVVSLFPAVVPPKPVRLGGRSRAPTAQRQWRGASGRRYTHSVYSLIECPPLPKAVFLLVRRDADGMRTVLHVGMAASDADSLNLAQVRQRGAQLGANEVHVYLQRRTDAARSLAAIDLRARLIGELAAEPSRACA
jgi:hypothetical protein